MAVPILGAILLVLAAAASVGAWMLHRVRRRLLDTPTSPAGALPQGPVEVKGQAVPAPGAEPLRSPISGTPCVHWSYALEEERTRTVHSTVNGKPRTRVDRDWVTIGGEASRDLFGVRDETGVALVDPRDADVPSTRTQTYGAGARAQPPEVLRFLESQGMGSSGFFGTRRRYVERTLAPGTTLYVLGTAAPGPEGRLVVQQAAGASLVISRRSEESLVRWYGVGVAACAVAGVALLAGGLYLLLA